LQRRNGKVDCFQILNWCIQKDTSGADLMYAVQQTECFVLWLASLRDLRAKLAVGRRLERAASGNLGDYKCLGGGVNELRINVSAGYRVYFTRKGASVIFLLVGGDKSTQTADILNARKLVEDMK
jgi:putative addiction module killer protein